MIGSAQCSEIFGSDLRRGRRNQFDGQVHLIKNAAGRHNEPEPPRMIEIGGLGSGRRFWSHWVTRVLQSSLNCQPHGGDAGKLHDVRRENPRRCHRAGFASSACVRGKTICRFTAAPVKTVA